MTRAFDEHLYRGEFDDYPIPPYDPTLSPEERAKRRAEAVAKLDAVIKEVNSKHRNDKTTPK